jgi:hypothetical protein
MYFGVMRLQRIYIDTSVIGGCHDEEFATWSLGLMKDFRLGNFKAVVSTIVDAEIQDAPNKVKETYYELIALDHEFLIALASVFNVDLLVSWNFKHIVHFDKIRRFTAVNIERGYKPLQIYSPREVTNYGDEKDV